MPRHPNAAPGVCFLHTQRPACTNAWGRRAAPCATPSPCTSRLTVCFFIFIFATPSG